MSDGRGIVRHVLRQTAWSVVFWSCLALAVLVSQGGVSLSGVGATIDLRLGMTDLDSDTRKAKPPS